MEWTPARIRLFRDVGLCLPQEKFARALGLAERTIGNAERGVHSPSLALRRALDQALDNASDAQRDRFLAAVALSSRTSQVSVDRGSSAVAPDPLARVLHDLRNAVLGLPLPVPMSVSTSVTHSAGSVKAATVQAHRLYQLAEYDAAAQLLTSVLTCTQAGPIPAPTNARPATAVAYLAIAKLATKLGDVVLASVAADRAMTAANESEYPALVGSATYQLLAIIAARRGDHNAAQDVLHDASQLAEQLDCDGNWLWTAFGPTNVTIHQLSVQSLLGDAKKAAQIAESIDTNALPAVLRGRRSQVRLEMAWTAAGQADDAVAVLHLLEAERVAEQTISRNASARRLLSILMARERRGDTPGLRGLAARAGLLP